MGGKEVLNENGERLERLRRMRGYAAGEIAAIVCANNTFLLDEKEIIEILWLWDRDRRELKEYRDAQRKSKQ